MASLMEPPSPSNSDPTSGSSPLDTCSSDDPQCSVSIMPECTIMFLVGALSQSWSSVLIFQRLAL